MAKSKFNEKAAFTRGKKMLRVIVRSIRPGVSAIAGEVDSAGRNQMIDRLLKLCDKIDGLSADIEALEKDWPKPAPPQLARPPIAPPGAKVG